MIDASKICLFVAELIVNTLKKRYPGHLFYDDLTWEIIAEFGNTVTASIYILPKETGEDPVFLMNIDITVNPRNNQVVAKKIILLRDMDNFVPAESTKELTSVLRSLGWYIVTKY